MDNNKNTGNWNTGNWNTGDGNTGNGNTGNRNTGNWNTGNRNTGNWNTGNGNTGNRNTGNWNSVNKETGFFNTLENEFIRVFNDICKLSIWNDCEKPSFLYFNITEWIPMSEMTEEEKEQNPLCKVTEGYLKEYDYKQAFIKSWNDRGEGEKELLLALPNFDAEIFKGISGIDVHEDDDKNKKICEIQSKMEALQKELEELKS